MTDFRALCAELADELDAETGYTRNDGTRITHPTVADARAALAQPEPQGPMDDELDEVWDEEGEYFALYTEAERFARAVLAHWGRPAIKPVPVAERLPGPDDCDADGECWWWHPDHKEDEFSDGWMLLKHKWADGRHDCDDSPIHTHWLPHHALPVPQQEVQ